MSKKYYLFNTENLYGERIKLVINQYKEKQRCAEVILKTNNKENIKHKAIIVCLLSALNLIVFHFSFTNISIYLIVFIAISFKIYKLLFKVQSESILILKSLGIQFSVQYYTGFYTTQFIPWSEIKKIFINEILTQQKVLYVLTVMTKEDNKVETLIPLFQNIKPRLNCIEIIYRDIEDIMLQYV